MNTIEIPFIKFTGFNSNGKAIGIASSKLSQGKNLIKITAKDRNGDLYYKNPIVVDAKEITDKYGVVKIQQNGMAGVPFPLKDYKLYIVSDIVAQK